MCCRDWAIPVDRATYGRYKLFPVEKLGARVAAYVSVPDPAAPDAVFALIQPKATGVCPFFAADRLCDIQREYGGELLSATCSSYPRALNLVGERLEGSLMLSCPEAARNVLLDPAATRVAGDLHSGAFRTDNYFTLAQNAPGVLYKPYEHFEAVRDWIAAILTDRVRPLWQRLVLLGSFCEKLSAVQPGDAETLVPALLGDYGRILGTNWGAAEMEVAPAQPPLQLNVLLRLTAFFTEAPDCGNRFRATYLDFVEGIAATETADDLERFAAARTWGQAYFAHSPHVLENYLLNYVFQHLFPFGRGGSARHKPHSIFNEYLLLATQFAWLNGLLAGVAGAHGAAFTDEHVIHTVQSFCREVDHNPKLPEVLLDFLRANRLDSLSAMAALLRP